ncbi:MAG: hypothetical protein GWP06_15375 [Actinobacteria bacterium]|nr:hypothetical protein [Actinomycetota bacterium]
MYSKEKGEQELQKTLKEQNAVLSAIDNVVNDTEKILTFWNDDASVIK